MGSDGSPGSGRVSVRGRMRWVATAGGLVGAGAATAVVAARRGSAPRRRDADPSARTAGRGAGRAIAYDLVVVAYRSRPLVEQLLAGLDAGTAVVLVDNAHDADGLSAVAAGRPGVRYLDGPGTGFAAGANRGAAEGDAPVIVFLNPDAAPTTALLDELTAEFADDPDLALSCGLDVEPDGSVQLGVGGWEPSVPRALVHAVGLHKLFPTAGLWARPEPGRPIALDWLGGSCIAVRREVFARIGGLDESYFVYSEDVELGRAVRTAGHRLGVRTDLPVEQVRTGSGDSRPAMLRRRGDSMTRYLRRHHPPHRVEGVRAALTAGIGARWVVTRARGRSAEAEEHAAYVRGMWAGPPP